MSFWALAHFFSFLANTVLAVYILALNRKSALNRYCAATLFLFCVWSLGTTLMRDPRISQEQAHLFNSVASIGWISFSSVFLLFALRFTGTVIVRSAHIIVLAMPVPFLAAQWSGAFMSAYRPETYGWVGEWSASLPTYLFYAYYAGSSIASLVLIWRFGARSRDSIAKEQAGVLFASVLVSLLLGSLASIILRRLDIYSVPPLGDVFTIAFAFGLFYATARYRLFVLNPSAAANKILETMTDALILVDTGGTIIACNPALGRMLDRDSRELTGQRFTTLFPDDEYNSGYVKELLRRGSLSNVTMSLVDRHGTRIPALISAGIMKNDGERPQGFVVVAHDYTPLREAERKIQSLLDTTRAILEWLPVGVVTVGRDRTILSANHRAVSLLKASSEEEILGAPCYRYLCPGNTGACPIIDENRKVDNAERTAVCTTGEHIPILKSVMEIELEGKDILIEAFIDISDIKRYQDELTFARDAAEAANRAKSAFLANMSHEIRTPLNAILGFTQLLAGAETDREKADKLSIIAQSGENLLSIINDILDFSRIEAGKVVLEEADFSVTELCEKIHGMFSLRAREKNLHLTVSASGEIPPRVIGDSQRVRQVVSNLVDNALKFTDHGGISIECGYENGSAVFRITDTGIGIPQEKHATVFNAFDQLDPSPSRKYGGAGLGLAIVKNLVHQMGGSISLESEPGKGSVFTVILPMKAAHVQAAAASVNQSPVGSDPQAAPTAPFRVLVAEDNDLNRQLMGKLLDTIHVEHDTAENGRVALDKLRNARAAGRPFDILLLDIQMPVMDGMTCLAEIRADRNLAGTHVIALTAHALTGDAEKFLDAGFDDYISKPMDIQNFFAKVRSLARAQG